MDTQLARVSLANLPTPLEHLPRLSKLLGVELWIKRDDLTGLATGGNKTRKLEFLIADALEQQVDCVITAGGPQSNHCRQTAAAAAKFGLECHLVLGGETQPPLGNLLLDQILGAQIHWVAKTERNNKMQQLAQQLQGEDRRPYVIPIGGSNAIGAVGYVQAFVELQHQLNAASIALDHIYFPTSSGGTQAGLVLGAKAAGFAGSLTAVSIDVEPNDQAFLDEVSDVANQAAAMLGLSHRVAPADLQMDFDHLGGGYGVVGQLERKAIRLMAETEGVLLGPVYSGRGFGALVDRIRSGQIAAGERVLYWHTGDESALHAYSAEVLAESESN